MASINPYLSFNGNCEEAFDFYKSVFGGEFAMKSRFGEMPSEQSCSPTEANKIMHVALPIGKDSILMGSDQPDGYGPLSEGNNFNIAVSPDSEEQATSIFNGLSNGGQVIMPMDKTFWGAYFGMLKDKYGIQWMVNYQFEQPK
jgi:PhnB protein